VRPIDVRYAEIRLNVECPPRSLEAAQRIAVHMSCSRASALLRSRDIPDIAARRVNGPI